MENDYKVFFEITNACNHKCFHCCKYWEDNTKIRTASYDTLDKIIAIPKSHLTISGGEPTLVKDKIKYLIENESIEGITINTNLTLLTDEDIEYYMHSNVELNVSAVSLIRENYIKITGKNTYDIFMSNLKKIPRWSTISFIVNPLSLPYLEYNVRLLLLMGFKFILVSPQTPTPYNNVDAYEVILRVRKLHDEYKKIANIVTQGCVGTEYCDHECEAGIGRILIDTVGDIYPCAPIHKPCKLGNIANVNIKNIKARGLRFYKSYPKHQRKICKGFIFGENICY